MPRSLLEVLVERRAREMMKDAPVPLGSMTTGYDMAMEQAREIARREILNRWRCG
jgi:hypothetical protein